VAQLGSRPRCVGLLGIWMLAGCGAGWHRPPEVVPGPWSPRQQVQVWSAGHSVRWHAVIVGPDSISGIPFTRPVECDNCRVSLARTAVDSVRMGQPVAGFWKSFALIIGVPLAVAAIWCGSDGGCPHAD
jgi:hypothetical protein